MLNGLKLETTKITEAQKRNSERSEAKRTKRRSCWSWRNNYLGFTFNCNFVDFVSTSVVLAARFVRFSFFRTGLPLRDTAIYDLKIWLQNKPVDLAWSPRNRNQWWTPRLELQQELDCGGQIRLGCIKVYRIYSGLCSLEQQFNLGIYAARGV